MADVSIPSPPDIVKSAEPVVSLADPESVVKVTPVISSDPPPPPETVSHDNTPEPFVVNT